MQYSEPYGANRSLDVHPGACAGGVGSKTRWIILSAVVVTLAIGVKIAVPRYWGDSTTYHYKLTFNVSTPDGTKSASSVVEIKSEISGSVWGTGAADHVRGEALYLDLGPGRRLIVALIWRPVMLREKRHDTRWGEVSPTGLLERLMGIKNKSNFDFQQDSINQIRLMKSIKATFEADPKDLPDLVTFADIADPNSVLVVDGQHLDATLGANVRWHSITIQIIYDPVTTGIEKRLPWLKSIHGSQNIDGSRGQPYINKRLANKLQRTDFIFPD